MVTNVNRSVTTFFVPSDVGFGAVCVPPQGTVHYTNQHGLNCTRTGIMSVCD
jgi:hypothetical protein